MKGPLHTRLCDLLGVEYPIVQTGMGWVAGPRLVAATSNAGALGILAAGTMTFAELRAAVAEVKERTDEPFGVNMRADQADVVDRVDLVVKEGVKVASFAQAPREDLIRRLKDGGVVVIPSIGAKRHAEKVAAWGVDAVLVQGGEGGGHTGQVPTSLLLPQVVDVLDIPVIAAGGFFDGRGLVAALAYGASGVAMGTRFLLTRDSTVPDAVKQAYLSKSVTDTIVTTQVDGVPHRVLRTEFVDRLVRSGPATSLPRAVRNALAFQRLSGTPWRDRARGPRHEALAGAHLEPGGHGGEHAHAAQGGHGRRPARPRRDVERPGRRRHRRPPVRRGARPAHHRRGRGHPRPPHRALTGPQDRVLLGALNHRHGG